MRAKPGKVRMFGEPRKLLTWGEENPKLNKATRWYQVGLNLLPTKKLCPYQTEGCTTPCLVHQGRGRIDNVTKARAKRNWLLDHHPDLFNTMVHRELVNAKKRADKKHLPLLARMNLTSDKMWYRDPKFKSWYDIDGIWFEEYTKIPIRYYSNKPMNLHLTFSRSESNMADCYEALNHGVNVAVVMEKEDGEWPQSWMGYPTLDGDASDERVDDPKGHWVLLTPKGTMKNDTTGMVVRKGQWSWE